MFITLPISGIFKCVTLKTFSIMHQLIEILDIHTIQIICVFLNYNI